jgi:hypothetical protein
MNSRGLSNRRRAVCMAAVLSLSGTAALPAGAQGAAPVKIQKCSVLQYQPPQRGFRRPYPYWYDYGYAGPLVPQGSPYTDGLAISYVNTSNKVADRIVFGVNYRGDFEHVVDAGTFSPNVTIDHTFADVFSGYAYIGSKPNSCVVRVVRFRDGSTWHASGMGARRQAQ